MVCTRAFQGQAGDTFGLQVVDIDNAIFCTVEVMVTGAGGPHEMRFGLHELMAGDANWRLQGNTTYTIVMQVRPKAAGQDVRVDVEIPMRSGETSNCSRTGGGMIGNWRVDVF